MANKVVTSKAAKKGSKAKKHGKPAHRVEIHKVANGFKTLAHYEPEMDAQGAPMNGGYQEPEENVFNGPDAHQQAFNHVSDAMGMPPAAGADAAEPDEDDTQKAA